MMPVAADQTAAGSAVLLVRLGERQYGVPLASVERVLPMAYVMPLPDPGEGLMGVLNLHGQVIPVIDPRPRLGVARPLVCAEQRLVLLRSDEPFLLWVDDVEEVVSVHEDELTAVPAPQASPIVPSVLRLDQRLVPILAPTALEPRGSLR
jgi:purine-binding chemotaxis protein CheW